MKWCEGYVGISCIDGSCPMTGVEEWDIDVVRSCRECFRYRGCSDCYFQNREECIVKGGKDT